MRREYYLHKRKNGIFYVEYFYLLPMQATLKKAGSGEFKNPNSDRDGVFQLLQNKYAVPAFRQL